MKIVSAFALSQEQRALIDHACPGAELYDPIDVAGPEAGREMFNPELIAPHLADCDTMAAYTIPKDPVKRAPRLRWLHCMAAGLDAHRRPACSMRATLYRPIPARLGGHDRRIYPDVDAAVFASASRIDSRQVRHQWTPIGHFFAKAEPLRGRTLGIIGYGAIGREAARLAHGFAMEVFALKRDPHVHRDPRFSFPGVGDPDGLIPSRWFGPEQCAELVALSDFIVVTLPVTSATRHSIGPRELAAARPGAYLVNVGRGEVIDQAALISALASGQIGGAGLDVMVPEPLPADHPLWDMDNVILTPDTAGPNKRYQDDCLRIFAENLHRLTNGLELINVVDVKRGDQLRNENNCPSVSAQKPSGRGAF